MSLEIEKNNEEKNKDLVGYYNTLKVLSKHFSFKKIEKTENEKLVERYNKKKNIKIDNYSKDFLLSYRQFLIDVDAEMRYELYRNNMINNGANALLFDLEDLKKIIINLIKNGCLSDDCSYHSILYYKKPNEDGTFDICCLNEELNKILYYKMEYCHDSDRFHQISLKEFEFDNFNYDLNNLNLDNEKYFSKFVFNDDGKICSQEIGNKGKFRVLNLK